MRVPTKLIFLLLLGAAACVVVAATVTVSHHHSRLTTVGPLPEAVVAKVQRTSLSNSFSIAGEFLPYQEVELHAKVSGYIRKINVDIGDQVRTGQLLAVLEIPELTAQVQSAGASVRHSQDEITRAENEVRRAEADHAALHAAAVRLKQASAARPGLIAEQELDDALAKDRAAEARVDAAKAALSAAREQLDVSNANKLRYIALSDYSRITAPFNGVVTWRYSDIGALIQAGTSNATSMPVVKLEQVDVLRLRFPVPESVAGGVHVGAPVQFRVQATGQQMVGTVTRCTDALDRSTRTMQVEVDVPNPGDKLAPGMYADVSLQVQHEANVLAIPVEAIRKSDNRTSVLLVNSGGRVEQRPIVTGIECPDKVQVVAGLQEGDRVIVGNLNTYQVGEQVQAKAPAVADATYERGKGTE